MNRAQSRERRVETLATIAAIFQASASHLAARGQGDGLGDDLALNFAEHLIYRVCAIRC